MILQTDNTGSSSASGFATASKVWFITGASRGFGRVWTQAALERGDKVVATARQLNSLDELKDRFDENMLALELDVTKPDQVKAVVEQAYAHFGRLDIVLNNAGYSLVGTIEEASTDEVRAFTEANGSDEEADVKQALGLSKQYSSAAFNAGEYQMHLEKLNLILLTVHWV